MSRLTEAEREALQQAALAWGNAEPGIEALERWPAIEAAVESILAARLAKVEALAEEWEHGGDRLIERNQDRRSPAGQQRWVEGYAMRRAASALRAALDADVPAEGRR